MEPVVEFIRNHTGEYTVEDLETMQRLNRGRGFVFARKDGTHNYVGVTFLTER